MTTNRKAQKILKLIIAYVLTFTMLTLTNPSHLSSIFLILPFILIFLTLYWTTSGIFGALIPGRESAAGFRVRTTKLLAILIGGLPVWLLVLQSIGQLTLRDTLVTITLFILAYAYIIKTAGSLS